MTFLCHKLKVAPLSVSLALTFLFRLPLKYVFVFVRACESDGRVLSQKIDPIKMCFGREQKHDFNLCLHLNAILLPMCLFFAYPIQDRSRLCFYFLSVATEKNDKFLIT